MTVQTTAPHLPEQALQPAAPVEPPSRISQWVTDLGHAAQAAATIVDTPLCPDAWWPLPPGVKPWTVPDRNPRVPLRDEDLESFHRRRQVAISTGAVILTAAESLGLRTLAAATTGVYVVGGRPTLYAETMLGMVHAAGWASRIVERSATRGAVAMWRRDEPESAARTYEMTIDQAVAAGYVPGQGPNRGKDRGGNEKYVTEPQTMLLWRAVSIGCRLEAPELMKGMRSAEEMADQVAADAVKVTATVAPAAQLEAADITAPRTAAPTADPLAGLRVMNLRREAEASTRLDGETRSAPDVASDQVEEPDTSQAPRVDAPATEAQWRQLNAQFAGIGVQGTGQKEARLKVVSHILERTVTSASDLTSADAVLVLDNLTRAVVDEVLAGTRWAGVPSGEAAAEALGGGPAQPSAAEVPNPDPADIEAQIAAARAGQDDIEAQRAAEQAQAEAYDPTTGREWQA